MRELAALSFLALAACDQTIDDQELTSEIACVAKAKEVFSELQGIGDPLDQFTLDMAETRNATTKKPEDFRFVSTGKFIFRLKLSGVTRPAKLTCTGDFNLKRLETVNLNGLDKRPTPGEIWSI
ncbi:MAG: hypothetical protein H0X36_15100 [Sphingomonadaceae bacterium]|nr:hypothetical protein [Sphingomonadaceae bacterium]